MAKSPPLRPPSGRESGGSILFKHRDSDPAHRRARKSSSQSSFDRLPRSPEKTEANGWQQFAGTATAEQTTAQRKSGGSSCFIFFKLKGRDRRGRPLGALWYKIFKAGRAAHCDCIHLGSHLLLLLLSRPPIPSRLPSAAPFRQWTKVFQPLSSGVQTLWCILTSGHQASRMTEHLKS